MITHTDAENFILILELTGTVAFAISGAMVAMRKEMDIFGVCTLGLITSVGGGVIRDLVLGITPPNTFRNPIYAATAIITSVIIFMPVVRKFLLRHKKVYDGMLFIMDTLGLGIFTTVGVRTAMVISEEYGMFLFIFVGLITGIGGGIMRDVLAGQTPYVFVAQIYACASIIGAVVCVALWPYSEYVALGAGSIIVVLVRALAVKYDINLPKAHIDED